MSSPRRSVFPSPFLPCYAPDVSGCYSLLTIVVTHHARVYFSSQLAQISDRMKSIHTNGLEIFPLFVSAIIIGNFARLPAKTMNIFAGAFIGSRVAYNIVYLLQATELQSYAR